ncbi:MAG: FAD-binding oxidoreductase [Gemmatimonadales bacterium]|nr:FAD-binding oxidoreductase [Gemmatimonadales bacterium]
MKAADAIVIGAGIVGAACAEALAEAGLVVRVLDRGYPGCGTTAAGMGHILVLDDSEAQLALTKLSRELWNARSTEWPDSVEWLPCGAIWVAADSDEMAMVHHKAAWFTERGVRAEILDAVQLQEAEPNLARGLAGGLYLPEDSVVYQPAATEHLLARAREHGASVESRAPVRAVGDGFVVMVDGARLEAEVIIIAAGLATPGLLDPPLPQLRVRPKKGHLAITARVPGFVRHQLIELGYLKSAHGQMQSSVAFNVQPRATGQVLVGSSRQIDNINPAVEMDMIARIITRAATFLPGIGTLPVIRTWAGLRPSTDHNLPVIGPLPGRPRLFVATGHEGVGITTSLGTGRLITDLALGRTPPIDPEPFVPTSLVAIGKNANG